MESGGRTIVVCVSSEGLMGVGCPSCQGAPGITMYSTPNTCEHTQAHAFLRQWLHNSLPKCP